MHKISNMDRGRVPAHNLEQALSHERVIATAETAKYQPVGAVGFLHPMGYYSQPYAQI